VTLDLVLVGFGNVARRFVRLVEEKRQGLARDFDLRLRIVGIITRRHGTAHSSRGLDAPGLTERLESGRLVGKTDNRPSVRVLRDHLARHAASARTRRLVVVETTTLDVGRGQPAVDHVRASLSAGAHVVTANKGPVAIAYRDLMRLADAARRRFLFEGTVMDGIPIFNLARETLPVVSVTGFRGVINSTTNFILTAMEGGETFSDALSAMQKAGIAEADPSLDVDGWDAAAKACALANVLLDARLTPSTIHRRGIRDVTSEQVAAARRMGRRIKLVASAARRDGKVTAAVEPVELPSDDLLAGLERQQNAIIFHTDVLGELAIVQLGAGLTQTAYALLSDLVTIARDIRPAPRRARPGRSLGWRGQR
jgi:homoserine dehydrogenase